MPKKILLADDSITIQKVVELTFSDGDYEVFATNNGAKAIQKLPEVRPDIILSDIIMPEKNGYEVCEYVKSHPEYRHIPVILLTGTFEPFDPDRAEKAGCDAVVTKPFESQSLIHKVEELIQQAEAPPALEEETPFATAAVEPPPAPEPEPSFREGEETRAWPIESIAPAELSATQPLEEAQPFSEQGSPFAEPPAGPSEFTSHEAEQQADVHETDIFSAPQPPESPMPMPFASEEILPPAEYGGDVRSVPMMDMRASEHAAEEPSAPESMEQETEEPLLGSEPPVPPAAEVPFEEHAEARAPSSTDETVRVVPPWTRPSALEEPAAEQPFAATPAEEESPFAPEEPQSAAEPSPFHDAMAAERAWSPSEEPEPTSSWDEPAPAEEPAGQEQFEPVGAPVEEEQFAPAEEPLEAETAEEEPEAAAAAASAPEPPAEVQEAPPLAIPALIAEAAGGAALSDDQIEKIARRVVEMMSERVVRDIAWEVIPDMAENVVRDRIRELESEA